MERFVVRSAWVVGAVVLAACSGGVEPAEEAAVAGVVLERDAAEDEPAEGADEPDPSEASDGQEPPIVDLVVLMTGQGTPGRVWFAADGTWVGLDGQSLEIGRDVAGVRFDATLDGIDQDDRGETVAGCEVRIAAPEDAQLQARGTLEGELIVERSSGDISRMPLTPLPIDLELAPGSVHDHVIEVATGTVGIDVERDAQVRCEGRFNRT